MRKANTIKFTIYFLLFAIILYFEYYAIEMQEGEWIAHDDRRPLTSMIALIGICPLYIMTWLYAIRCVGCPPCCCKPFLTFGAYYGLVHCRHLAHTKRNMNAQGFCRRI